MSDDDDLVTEGEGSSSRFPFVSLEKAVARAKQLYDDAGSHEILNEDAFGTWGYSLKSSGGFQTIAALKMYGLINKVGAGKLKISPEGMIYFREERPEQQTRWLRHFALQPKLFATLWKGWGDKPPSDHIARSHLKVERNLSDQGARSVLGIYKENIDFAHLKAEAIGSDIAEAKSTEAEKSADRDREPPQDDLKRRDADVGMKEDVFSLAEGDATFRWPAKLSEESYQDLEDWTKLLLRKIKRAVQGERKTLTFDVKIPPFDE